MIVNKELRLKAYKKALEYFIKGDFRFTAPYSCYICDFLKREISGEEYSPTLKEVAPMFPELMEQKPLELEVTSAWWPEKDIESRIQCLKNCITKIESYENQM